MRVSTILSLSLAVTLPVALTARGKTNGGESLIPEEPSDTSHTGGLLPSRTATPIRPLTADGAGRGATGIGRMAIRERIRNLGTAARDTVKRGVGKLIPSTTNGRVILSLGLLTLVAAMTVVWTGGAGQLVGDMAPAVPLTIERLQQVLPSELASYGSNIGALEALPTWALLEDNPDATYICSSCFDRSTPMLEVVEHCSRIYQNFQANVCPAMEVLDAVFFWRGLDIRAIWGDCANLESFVAPQLEVLADNWINAVNDSA